MPRAVWRGSISFGLVAVPVRLYPAVRRRDVRFKEMDRATGQRIRHLRVRDVAPWGEEPHQHSTGTPSVRPVVEHGPPGGLVEPPEGSGAAEPMSPAPPSSAAGPVTEPAAVPAGQPVSEEVPRAGIARGFELGPGRWVEITDEDLAALQPERTRTIDVEQFVSRKDLDPLYFESSYYVVPDRERVRPFAVLLRAMQQTNRAAICWLVLRSRRHLAALQPRGGVMLLSTLLFADEIVPSTEFESGVRAGEATLHLTEREVEMAELLLDTLSGPFEPERYRDEYRERVLALIESRAGQQPPVEEPLSPPAPSGIDELMAALSASLEQARALRKRSAREPRRRRDERRSG